MAINLIEMVGRHLSPSLVSKLGGALGEDSSTASRGAAAAVPAILGGIVQKGSTEHGASDLLDSFKSYESQDSTSMDAALDDPARQQSLLEKGRGALSSIFGGRSDSIAETIGSHSGMKKSSALGMMGMLAPMVMGLVGRHARENKLDPSGLSSLLRSQSGHLSKALPGGLGSMLGLGGVTAGAASAVNRVVTVDAPTRTAARTSGAREHGKKGRGWLWGALALGAVAVGGFFLCSRERPDVSMPTPQVQEPQQPGIGGGPPPEPQPQQPEQQPQQQAEPQPQQAPEPAPAPMATEEAPQATGGGPAESAGGATELQQYLEGSGEVAGEQSFALRELSFEHGSSHLTQEGRKAADALAETLEANPNAKVRIEGHTDSTGSPEVNRQLSEARAESVANHLQQKGIARDRVETAGRGPDEPVAPNETEEGRAQNRRIDVVVLER